MILDGKTVMVIGVGPGLGTSCARVALRDGANVVVVARNEERLQSIASDLDPSGERVIAASADIMDQASLDAAVDTAVEQFGGLDAVINVAAMDSAHASFADLTDEILQKNVVINVLGAVHVVKAAERAFDVAGGGSVVLIGSQASLKPVGVIPQSAYAAAKSALLAMARDMAEELGPKGIRVNTVVPTWMWGPNVKMYCEWQAAERGCTAEDIRDEIAQGMALRKMPTDADVAEAAAFFASDRSNMITGQRLLVNAGEFYDT
ncbi:MAG: NAD(P)-dependent dehydrogenase (short-subunit alcohol dehydrogenase family) [Candidatus Aldehydirespiratoraceae bacterium]|jgi:NAD(P)-dependent dehydrogenase (short-subunit alcohol dehydrogenase family)